MRKLGSKTYYKKKADNLVSQIVRYKGHCEWCGTKQGQLQCAHYVGRANHTLRFDLFNVLCLCATCHRKGHNDPQGFVKWFEAKFPNRAKYIEMNKNKLTKRTAKDYKELVEGLQDKLNELKSAEGQLI